jgi:hypothetical protein
MKTLLIIVGILGIAAFALYKMSSRSTQDESDEFASSFADDVKDAAASVDAPAI